MLTLSELLENYGDHKLELKAVTRGVVHLLGLSDQLDNKIISVQVDTTTLINRNLVFQVKPLHYMKGEDKEAHIYNLRDVPKIKRVIVHNLESKIEKETVYEDDGE